MSKIKLGFFFAALLLVMIPIGIAFSDSPLLQLSDLKYQGAFRLPQGDFGSPQYAGFSYGGTALAHNPAKNSLSMVGHDMPVIHVFKVNVEGSADTTPPAAPSGLRVR